jgi:hypothetical protein
MHGFTNDAQAAVGRSAGQPAADRAAGQGRREHVPAARLAAPAFPMRDQQARGRLDAFVRQIPPADPDEDRAQRQPHDRVYRKTAPPSQPPSPWIGRRDNAACHWKTGQGCASCALSYTNSHRDWNTQRCHCLLRSLRRGWPHALAQPASGVPAHLPHIPRILKWGPHALALPASGVPAHPQGWPHALAKPASGVPRGRTHWQRQRQASPGVPAHPPTPKDGRTRWRSPRQASPTLPQGWPHTLAQPASGVPAHPPPTGGGILPTGMRTEICGG